MRVWCSGDGLTSGATPRGARIATLLMIVCLTGAVSARGQKAFEPNLPGATLDTQAAENDTDRVRKEIARARVDGQNQKEQVEGEAQVRERGQFDQPGVGGGVGGGGRYVNRLQVIARRAPGGGKALVIRSTESDAKEQADLEEDLTVMSHILDKALQENLGGQSQVRTAMGIDVFFAPGGNQIRSLFLDGYGALFMLKVGFPLLPPPSKDAAPKEERPENSSWEEAKRELYGQPGEGRMVTGPAEEYDEDKVRKLKDTLLEALKNASNIRNLKPDDLVTVCVVGGGNGARFKKITARAGVGVKGMGEDREVFAYRPSEGSAPVRGTIMTIRVKKSDAESFAKGKLNLDEFRKKAKIIIYAGIVGGEGGSSFGFGGGSDEGN